MSYELYEKIYWNVPDTFRLVARGTEDKPIYIPSGKTIVETCHRYTAPGFDFNIFPRAGFNPSSDAIQMAHRTFSDFLRRERFFSKFAGNKRYGLIRGDWLWHIIADPTKPPGRRLSIHPLDPASYFPVWSDDDLDKILGVHIVEQFVPQGETDPVIKRTTYRKSEMRGEVPGGQITYEQAIFATDDWGGPDAKAQRTIVPQTALPITTIPIYHVKNFDEPQNPFGSSEMRGLERIIAAVNQGISDEELTLALEGLGVYVTDAPPPTDDDGNEVDWVMGPGRVVETPPGHTFTRVNGVNNVNPAQNHMEFLINRMDEASSTPEIAKGAVDVAVAQSGIALKMQLAPLLAKTDEKDIAIKEVHAQMFYDLVTQWFPAYEGITFEGMIFEPLIGDKLPVDREARFKELNGMLDRQVISRAYYRHEAAKLGYTFPENIGVDLIEEKAALTQAEDLFGLRMEEELGNAGGTGGTGTPNPQTNGSVQTGSGTILSSGRSSA